MSKNIKIDEKNVEIIKSIHLKDEEWKNLYSASKAVLSKNIKVDGFRPGKAPQHMIDKMLPAAKIYNHAIDTYLNKNAKSIYDEVSKDNERVVNVPQVVVDAISDSEAKFRVIYPLMTKVENLNLDKVKAKFEYKLPTENEVKEYVEAKLERNALLLPLDKKEKTALGDVVTLNYKGFVNDEAFDGGEAEGFELKLGSKTFIDTFEDQLVGKTIGYKGEVHVTFPESYPVDKLAGAKADFQVEIVDAKRPEKIALSSANYSAVTNLTLKKDEEVMEASRLSLAYTNANLELDKYIDTVVKEVVASNEINVNRVFVLHYVQEKKKQVQEQLKQQGAKLEDYLQLIGKSEAEFNALIEKEEKEQIINSIVLNHLVGAKSTKDVEVSQKELDMWFDFRALETSLPVAMFKMQYESNENIKNAINSQVKDFIVKKQFVAKFNEKAFKSLEKDLDALHKDLLALNEVVKKYEEEAKSQKEEKAAKKPAAKKSTSSTTKKAPTKKTTKKVE